MNPKDTQMFEITEYLVNFSSMPKFRNLDLLGFNKKLDECTSYTKIEMVQL